MRSVQPPATDADPPTEPRGRSLRFLGHPVHPMLVSFPIGLLATSVVADVLYWLTGRRALATFSAVALVGGLFGGMAAAAVGYLDWRRIPTDSRAHDVGRAHGAGNAVVLLLFGTSLLTRRANPALRPDGRALLLSLLGGLLAAATSWLGGELVFNHGIGVTSGADADAPPSWAPATLQRRLAEVATGDSGSRLA